MPAHAGTPTGAQRDGELLPQEQVLHHEGLPAPEGDESSADEERQPVQHGAMIAYGVSHRPDGVLAPHSPKVVVVAVMRKLLELAWTLLHSGQPFSFSQGTRASTP